MHLDSLKIKSLEKIRRLNLINSISGIKSANLIGTISDDQKTNLAIFSSVIHLGSNPALLGIICRPEGEVPRHTLENIKDTGYYTINSIHTGIVEQAHYTSAKFDKNISEFEACGLTEEYYNDFRAPYVQECLLKIGMEFKECVPLTINDTQLIIGEVKEIIIPDEVVDEQGQVDLSPLGTVGVSGLNNYYKINKEVTLPYARVENAANFKSRPSPIHPEK